MPTVDGYRALLGRSSIADHDAAFPVQLIQHLLQLIAAVHPAVLPEPVEKLQRSGRSAPAHKRALFLSAARDPSRPPDLCRSTLNRLSSSLVTGQSSPDRTSLSVKLNHLMVVRSSGGSSPTDPARSGSALSMAMRATALETPPDRPTSDRASTADGRTASTAATGPPAPSATCHLWSRGISVCRPAFHLF